MQVLRVFTACVLALASLSSSAVVVNDGCRCKDISASDMWRFDAALFLTPSEEQQAISEHLPWGVPTSPTRAKNERLLIQKDYIINHDADLRVATWAAYHLTAAELGADLTRTECFRADPRLQTQNAASCRDYDEPFFDQGHLVPNSDMERSLEAMINTYVMSNMTPQYCAFNRGTWLLLEKLVRKWVQANGDLYVFSGSIFDKDGDGKRDRDSDARRMLSADGVRRVAVPTHFFKILIRKESSVSLESLAFVVPNVPTKLPNDNTEERNYLRDHLASIDQVEALTGVKFLPDLETDNHAVAQALTAAVPSDLWAFSGSWPSRLDSLCHETEASF